MIKERDLKVFLWILEMLASLPGEKKFENLRFNETQNKHKFRRGCEGVSMVVLRRVCYLK